MNCHKEFALCIYRGDSIPIELKKLILNKLHVIGSKEDKVRLDNYLNMYKIHLQTITNDIIIKSTDSFYLNLKFYRVAFLFYIENS